MEGGSSGRNETKFCVEIRSKIHKEIYHKIMVDLHCYESMSNKKELKNKNNMDLHCYESMPNEKKFEK